MIPIEALDRLRAARALVLLRAEGIADALLDAYVEGGLRAIEVSFVARDAAETIARLRARHPSVLVGAGTVRRASQANTAAAAGAEYLISPSAAPEVAEWSRRRGILHIPAVMTPSEVDAALNAGARLLKLFPAARLGPGYVSDLRAPFPEVEFLASGGITIDTVPDYLRAGVRVVGMGGVLAASRDADDVRTSTAALVKAVQL
ncbi:bifunctional 4-hydroxy-2-oxoglutarate aldolase/2-dehydro-3-deoxy-phosphogluconate aldolase [Mycolicibacterium komossense]|uniref:Bifunctional 4-hydroxy-2-oxoglutarate aldolase/2-dehydro-3-deoxy-phosphogluconate aldolase n=1 Tax=Mycolicibacterium komossense TaxID=1779 RepID=A0ABT3C7C1_9MYCO|nr:bifunctional 4-hydroxy-2-oxoglutarate aldolase/2-dehydro-3-deoxy-phosphogluconate aldolase [Mycolicibacterium komossense]MCV7225385.1 bifunctional 4-hydroxy-2-oxoglutarate aldolase/2-dehydro-3-deoxy-phosphogluconate aldolase [Mycolicibacterium komossense]